MQETQEMQVRSLSWADALEEEMVTLSSILSWKVLWTEEPGAGGGGWGATVHDVTKSWPWLSDWAQSAVISTNNSFSVCILREVQFSSVQFSSFQALSRVWLFATPWIKDVSFNCAELHSLEALSVMLDVCHSYAAQRGGHYHIWLLRTWTVVSANGKFLLLIVKCKCKQPLVASSYYIEQCRFLLL